jgi:hypothetical protein
VLCGPNCALRWGLLAGVALALMADVGNAMTRSGYWFLNGCGRGSCWPEVYGFLNRSASSRRLGFGKPRWCLPKLVTYHIVAQDFRDYLRQHPTILREPYEVSLEMMLTENYACLS